MFETVNDLANRLPQPEWTGDPANDRRAIEQHIANGKLLRSEAFRAFWHALITSVRGAMRQGSAPIGGAPSPQH
jgi:hypothetical protein